MHAATLRHDARHTVCHSVQHTPQHIAPDHRNFLSRHESHEQRDNFAQRMHLTREHGLLKVLTTRSASYHHLLPPRPAQQRRVRPFTASTLKEPACK
jgi:S-adenosylmethionine:diacylglycerol 3-amino-3-carboxypropyl transferase